LSLTDRRDAFGEAQNLQMSFRRLGRLGADLAPNRYARAGEFFLTNLFFAESSPHV
jgi:hypothetical protein